MNVILNVDVPALGKVGDVIKVADGYARNFLLPRKKAEPATESNLKRLEHHKADLEATRQKLKGEAETLGQKLSELVFQVERQAGEEDKIFGSVSSKEMVEFLKANGIVVDKKNVLIREPIRKTGEYTIQIHLHNEVVVPLKVLVVKK